MNGRIFLIKFDLKKSCNSIGLIKPAFLYSSTNNLNKNKKNWSKILPVVNETDKFTSSFINPRRLLFSSSSNGNVKLSSSAFYFSQIRYAVRGGPGYTNFAHGKYKLQVSKYAYFWYAFLTVSIVFLLFFDYEKYAEENDEKSVREVNPFNSLKQVVSKAKEIATDDSSDEFESRKVPKSRKLDDDEDDKSVEESDSDDNEKSSKKSKLTFKNRKIIQYENRIRQYSTPDKVFRYFATLKIWSERLNDYEVFMTPEDFVRSLTYGVMQPEGLGLDSYHKFDPKMQKLEIDLSEDSVFKLLGQNGLISFSDYIFLVTLLSTPTRHFEIAFHMFDLDGNGNIDIEEFEELQTILRNQTSLGQRHRDTHMTGNVIKENFTLNEYFFGQNFSELLTVNKFIAFQKKLQEEVLTMEFNLCNLKTRKDGVKVIKEDSFCEMILAYAGLSSAKTKKMLKHISTIYDDSSDGITLSDYRDFFQVLRSIQDIDTALKFYAIAGASIDKSILKHVSKTVAGVNLSDHVIEVVFNLFDENGDGKLSHREFVKVMKKRWMRGLQMPKDTGFIKFIEAFSTCTKQTFFRA